MNIIKLLLKIGTFFYGLLVKPFIIFCYSIFYRQHDKKASLPKFESDLLTTPAHILAQKIRQKKVENKHKTT
jgi:hypothetical protein